MSFKCGILNGYFYGYENRRDERLQEVVGEFAEDVERSLRFFQCDGKVTESARVHSCYLAFLSSIWLSVCEVLLTPKVLKHPLAQFSKCQ